MNKFLKGFYYAAVGIVSCVRTERNMRVHLCFTFYVLLLMPFYDFSRGEKAAVFLCIGAVMAAEAFNTAIEAVVDMVCKEKNKLAKCAKDAAAGAVLLTAIAAAAVGIMLYIDFDALGEAVGWYIAHPVAIAGLVGSAVLWVFAITRPSGKELLDNHSADNDVKK